jgi:metal-dependent amidase/aminoacylase/carboxypeptidase family protein
MQPTLERVAGREHVLEATPVTGGEDFAEYQTRVPGLFVFVGGRTPGAAPEAFPPNHSPRFRLDEDVLVFGVRTLANLAVDYLEAR